MKLHLFTCEACKRYLEQVAVLKEAAHAHGEAEETSDLSAVALTAEAKERIKGFLRGNNGLAF